MIVKWYHVLLYPRDPPRFFALPIRVPPRREGCADVRKERGGIFSVAPLL